MDWKAYGAGRPRTMVQMRDEESDTAINLETDGCEHEAEMTSRMTDSPVPFLRKWEDRETINYKEEKSKGVFLFLFLSFVFF